VRRILARVIPRASRSGDRIAAEHRRRHTNPGET